MNEQIIVYGAEWCAFCHHAMRYFDQIGVKYTYKNVDLDPQALKDCVEKSRQTGIPVIAIAGDIVVGFNRPQIDDALSKHNLRK